MATVNKEIADKIIAGNGYYKNDPRVVKVVQYTNAWGGDSYGLVYRNDHPDRYHESRYVINPQTIWEAK